MPTGRQALPTSPEALLLIDEPGSGLPGYGPSLPQVLCTTPLTGCTAFVGAVPGPNLRPGGFRRHHAGPERVSGCSEQPTSVTFFGVPVLPPSGHRSDRVFRITNVLVNATACTGQPVFQGYAGSGVDRHQRQHLVPYLRTRLPLSASYRAASPPPPRHATQLPQCSSQTKTSVNLLQFSENFGTSFKTRVLAQTNTVYAGPDQQSRSRTSPALSTTPSPDLCSRSATRWPVWPISEPV